MDIAMFEAGVRTFLRYSGPHKQSLIEACKRKYPELGGRCVNIICVPQTWLGVHWGHGFVTDPGRYAINMERIETVFDTDKSGSDLSVEYAAVRKAVAECDPNNQVVYWFVCSGDGGTHTSIDILG